MGISHKLGPGLLTLGETGTSIEFGTRCRSITITPEVDEGDALPVLSGDEIEPDIEETYTLAGTVLQDYDADSLFVWCHVNANTILPFVFRPDSDRALEVRGSIKVRRISTGGDVKTRNTSDFEFPGRNGIYELWDMAIAIPAKITAWAEVADSPANPADPWD